MTIKPPTALSTMTRTSFQVGQSLDEDGEVEEFGEVGLLPEWMVGGLSMKIKPSGGTGVI